MLNSQQILEKAIQKAIDGGWSDHRGLESIELVKTSNYSVTLKGWVEFVDEDGNTDESRTELECRYIDIIFNHDFAKALWGEEMISTFPWAEDGSFKYETKCEAWIHHLQQMVISENPIKYLGETI